MTDKNFCMKSLLLAKEFNQMSMLLEDNPDQSAIYDELSDIVLSKYDSYRQKHNNEKEKTNE